MKFRKETAGTIVFHSFLKNRSALALVFPSAGAKYLYYKRFLDSLSKHVDVVFIEEGYFGLSINEVAKEKYTIRHFLVQFLNYFRPIIKKYPRIIILGQSVGSLHAIDVKHYFPKAKLILVSPTLADQHFQLSPLDKIFLDFILETKLGMFLLTLFKKNKLILNNFVPIKRAGLFSYIRCLRDIVIHGAVNPEKLDPDTVLIVGEDDLALNDLCHLGHLIKRDNTYLINSNHTILQNKWKIIEPLLSTDY